MSNNESFIDEVSDAVRRDKLFATFRRYGWIGVLVIAGVVGGTAWQSYSRAKSDAAAQAQGDAILAALQNTDAAGRLAGLQGLAASAVATLLLAAEQEAAGDSDAAAATLDGLANDTTADMLYRQLAGFKAAILRSASQTPDERIAALDAMTAPGHPLRLLADEQVALAFVEKGDVDAALTRLQAINQDAEVSPGLQDRAQSLIVGLGGVVETVAEPILGEPVPTE